MAFRIACKNVRHLEKIPNSRFHTMVGVVTSSNRQNRLYQSATAMPEVQQSEVEEVGKSTAVHTVQGVQGDIDLKESIAIIRSKYTLAKIIENSKLTRAERRDLVAQGVQGDLYDNSSRFPESDGEDPHVEANSADPSVNLYSVMQSNVPEPFNPSTRGTPTHVNMPGGGMKRHDKYTYDSVQSCHHTRCFSTLSNINSMDISSSALLSLSNSPDLVSIRESHSKGDSSSEVSPSNSDSSTQDTNSVKLSQAQRLKRAVKEYGATVVVFHVSISLMSLGACYLAVSR